MKKNFYSFIIILLTIAVFVVFNINKNKEIVAIPQRRLLDNIVFNQYVNDNSIISAVDLHKIIYRKDVKVIKIIDNTINDNILPKTQIIRLADIETTINGVSGVVAPKEDIEEIMSNLGIKHDDTIIVYDDTNTPGATRLFFVLKLYGHRFVRILNGGANAWLREGFNTGNVIAPEEPSMYTSDNQKESMIATIEDIEEDLDNKNVVFLDVRTKEEYENGHIPNSVNIYYNIALNDDGTFKDFNTLKKIYMEKGVTQNREMIYVYCTTGKRSSLTYFVLHELLGYNNVLLYDGSFSEYENSSLPIEK